MYFQQFPKIYYEFPQSVSVLAESIIPGKIYIISDPGTTDFTAIGASANKVGVRFIASGTTSGSGIVSTTTQETTLQILTDITTNVRIRKEVLENVTLYDEYDILEGETPEIIAEKIYGNPELHWVIMIVNQRYDHYRDFPLTTNELEQHCINTYGEDNIYTVHHYEKNGIITEALATMKIPNDVYSKIKINDFIVNEPIASAKIMTNVHEFSLSNAKNKEKASASVLIKLYDAQHTVATGENYIGTARIYTMSSTSVALGDISLNAGKSISDIRSIYRDTNSYMVNLQLITSTYSTVGVLVDYGRFSTSQFITVKGVREGSYEAIANYAIPQNGFVLNDNYFDITNYMHEVNENEKKRRIKIISPRLIDRIITEFQKLINPI